MMYKQKTEQLLETLYSKLQMIERVAVGQLPASTNQVNKTITDSKKIVEQLAELVSMER